MSLKYSIKIIQLKINIGMEVLELGKKVNIKARTYKKCKKHIETMNSGFTISLAVITSVQAVLSTYSLFQRDTIAVKATNIIFSILVAAASAYISVADFPEKIARYEAASSMYTHMSALFSDIYNNINTRPPEITTFAMNYCKNTIAFLEGMGGGLDTPSGDDSGQIAINPERVDKMVLKYQLEFSNICDDGGYLYLPIYKYTYTSFMNKNYFHIILEGRDKKTPKFCNNHINITDQNFNIVDHFYESIESGDPIFKTWVINMETVEKKYIICERHAVHSKNMFLAVIVDSSCWSRADIKEANHEISTTTNILDCDLFNPDSYKEHIIFIDD